MNAEVVELFPETWEQKVRRLAVRRNELRAVRDPIKGWPKSLTTEWKRVNLELSALLNKGPS